MKKIICFLCCLILGGQLALADTIDDTYVNLIFDKFASYDEQTKLEKAEELRVFMKTEERLDLLYTLVVTTQGDNMEKYSISSSEIKNNIEALKTWTYLDRMALIDAGVSGNRDMVSKLNEKYTKTPDIVIPPSSGVPIGGTPIERPVDQTETGIESVSESFISGPKKIISHLKNKIFEDTLNHWSRADVLFLRERGIISGRSEDTFVPEDPVKKSEVVTLVMNLIVSDASNLPRYSADIPDISYGYWYDTAMKNAYTLELLETNYLGYLEPERLSSREEVVDIMIRSLGVLGFEIAEENKLYKGGFKDYSDVQDHFKTSMAVALNLGFINGMGDQTIQPEKNIKRGEMATIMKRFYNYIINNMNKEENHEM